jgi:ATP-dependent Zn protease
MQNEFPFEAKPETPAPEPQMQDFPDFDTPGENLPFDCGGSLAQHMLRSAMGQAGKPLPLGLYIVVAPSDEWCPALKLAVQDVYLGGSRRTGLRRLGSSHPYGQVLELPSTTAPKTAEQTTSAVQDALTLGKPAFVIAGSLAVVPAALQRASDQVIVVLPPCRQGLKALVREIAPNTRHLNFRGLACEALTPTSLRLAYRQDGNGHAFLQRLKALTTPEPQAKTVKSIPLAQLHGVDEAKSWADNLKADLARYREGQLAWQELSRGLLLSGPPGTAKTTLAKAIANYCGMAFVPTTYAAWQRNGNGHQGDTLKAMAASFNEARARAPAILFIDELDTIGARGQNDQHEAWYRAIINAMLEQMDGSISNEGVVFVGATNYPGLIDPAILRSGRMEDHIVLRAPGVEALAKIYRDQLEGMVDETVDLRNIGRMSAGATGADVVKICATARRRARNAGRPVSYDDLLVAIAGEESHTGTERQLRIAIHEAGHAVAVLAFAELSLEHVTIVGQGDRGGGASFGMRDRTHMTPAVLNAYLTAILGGRAAEEILLGEISSGAGGREGCDLSCATQLAAEAELSLGLRAQGLIWYAPLSAEKLAKLFAQRPDLEHAVRERLDQAYSRARELIRVKAPLVRRLAEQLLTSKVMSGEEVAALARDAGGVEPLPAPEHAPDSGCLQ